MKNGKLPWESFWSKYRVDASLLLNSVHVDAIMAATGEWSSVAREIGSTVRGSKLGERMFGFAEAFVVSEKLAADFALAVAPLVKKVVVVAEDVAKARTTMLKHIEELNAGDILGGRRAVAMEYLGLTLEVIVKDVHEEVEMRVACVLKSRAVGRKDGLRALALEAGLLWPMVENEDCGCKQAPPTLELCDASARGRQSEHAHTETHTRRCVYSVFLSCRIASFVGLDSRGRYAYTYF